MSQFRPLSETKFINDANLVAYYPLENLTDVKGGFNLTNDNSTAFNTGKFSNCSDAGSGNTTKRLYYTGSILSDTQIMGACSLSMWVNFYNTTTTKWFTGLYGGSIVKGFRIGISISGTTSSTITLSYSGSNLISTPIITTGTWYHIVATNDGTTVKFYLNGSLVGSTTLVSASTGAVASFNLHWSDGVGEAKSATMIDDTAILSRVLSSAEVNELYQGMTYGEYLGDTTAQFELEKTDLRNDSSLVSYWRMEGNSNDSKGTNNGTDTSIDYIGGKFGQCASINSNSDRISLGDPASLKFSGAHTLGIWANFQGINRSNLDQLFFKGNDGVDFACIQLDFSGTNTVRYRINSNRTTSGTIVECSSSFTIDNNWHLFVAKYTGSAIYIYLDGKQIATNNTSITIDTTGNWYIGNTNNSRAVGKLLDDAFMFNRALSDSEIQSLYRTGSTKLLLHLNGNSTDSSGNGHDLTNYNSTPFENGKFGQAPHFNGTNQSLRGTIDDPDTYAAGYTWSFWAYNDATITGRRWIASTNESGSWGTCFAGSWESPYTNLWIKFGRGITNDFGDNTGYTIPVGQWFNVVMVAEGTSQKCYVNGKLVSLTTKSSSMANNGTTFSIGSNNSGDDYFWDGSVDEFIQEARAWADSEVSKYYTYTKGRFGIL